MKKTKLFASLVLAVLLAGSVVVSAAPKSASLEKYVKNGRLSKKDAAKIKEEVKAELKGEIVREIKAELKKELAPEVRDTVKSEITAKISADRTKEIEVAKKEKDREFKTSGYMHMRYTDDNTPVNAGAGAAGGSSWNVARVRMIMQKKLDDKLAFYLQTNMTGNTAAAATVSGDWKVTLFDATINYLPAPGWEIRLGQFTMPFGLEVPLGAREYYLVNTAMSNNNAQHENVVDDTRGTGMRLKYNRKGNPFTYIMSVTNGEGVNRRNDTNDGKDLILRLTYSPKPTWQVGVSGEKGNRFKAASAAVASYGATKAAATAARDFDRERFGVDFMYKKDRWFWQTEYKWLRTGVAGRVSDLVGRGGYIEGGYMLNPKLQLAVKEDIFQWDISDAAGNTNLKTHVLGLNWFFHSKAKWQFVYENRKETPAVNNDRFLSQIQLEF